MPPKKKITDKAYDKALAKNLPNKWVKLAFRYFSESTTEKDLKPSKILVGVLFVTFLLGLFGTMFHLSDEILRPLTIFYTCGVFSIVSFLFAAVFMNNFRLRKIIKELGVSKRQYNTYVTLRNAKDKAKK